MISNEELAERIAESPRLRQLRDNLMGEVSFRVQDSFAIDPVTIIMIISIIVQVVIHCREKRNDEDIVRDIQDIRSLPPRKIIRLRRRLNALWRDCRSAGAVFTGDVNPFLTAVYELGENSDAKTIQELIALAD